MAIDPILQAQLQVQLAQVQTIIASGLDRASVEGNSSDFRSLEELYRIRDDLLGQLGLTQGRRRRTVASYSGGFYPGAGPY